MEKIPLIDTVRPTTRKEEMTDETGFKWYLRYVIVPLIGGGGLIALIVAYTNIQTVEEKQSKTSTEGKRIDESTIASCDEVVSGEYTKTCCKSIIDSKTNLEWFIGEDRNHTWYEAHYWAGQLGNCGGGWRLPTVKELSSIYNPSKEAGIGYFFQGSKYPSGKHLGAALFLQV